MLSNTKTLGVSLTITILTVILGFIVNNYFVGRSENRQDTTSNQATTIELLKAIHQTQEGVIRATEGLSRTILLLEQQDLRYNDKFEVIDKCMEESKLINHEQDVQLNCLNIKVSVLEDN